MILVSSSRSFLIRRDGRDLRDPDFKDGRKAVYAIVRGIKTGARELETALLHLKDTGILWYDKDVKQMMDHIKTMNPELADSVMEDYFKILLAITSVGQNPRDNLFTAHKIYTLWKDSGYKTFPSKNPDSITIKPKNSEKTVQLTDYYKEGDTWYGRNKQGKLVSFTMDQIGVYDKGKNIGKKWVEQSSWTAKGGFDDQFRKSITSWEKDLGKQESCK